MLVRALVILKGRSGLPEDVFVNNLYFESQNDPVTEVDYDDIGERIIGAWSDQLPGTPSRLADFMSNEMSVTGHELRLYDLAQPKPRVPIYQETWDFPLGVALGAGYPANVAFRVSYESERLSGVNMKRRRGGHSLGPLKVSTGIQEAVTNRTRPSAEFGGTVLAYLAHLRGIQAGGVWRWVIHSETTGQIARWPVHRYWIDDRFDTQKRRLSPARGRTYGGAVAP